jgi:hypothetical protein
MVEYNIKLQLKFPDKNMIDIKEKWVKYEDGEASQKVYRSKVYLLYNYY